MQLDFKYNGPFGPEITAAMDGLAGSIAQEPGLIWKIWAENQITREADGIYLFSDEQSAKNYITKHSARLKGFGIGHANTRMFDVNIPLTEITKGLM